MNIIKRNKIYAITLFIALCVAGNIKGQVRIGDLNDPTKGTILDLDGSYKGGLKLSNVDLISQGGLGVIPSSFGVNSTERDDNLSLIGIIVYNTDPDTEGVYYWNGHDWIMLSKTVFKSVTGVSITSFPNQSLFAGGSVTMAATVTPSDATNPTITWTSSNTGVATIDAKTGVLKAVGVGNTFIKVTAGGVSSTNCLVTVNANSAWVLHSIADISSYQSASPSSEVTLSMVKGESEHFQLVLQVEQDNEFSIDRLNNTNDLEIDYRTFALFEGHEDVLVPCNGVVKTSEKLAKLWITYRATPQATAGKYKETLIFTNGNQKFHIGVNINIHDITLPETPSIPSVFGIYSSNLKTNGSTAAENVSKYKEMTDLLLTYRISPFSNIWPAMSSPYQWNDTRTIPYLSDKRFSRIAVPYFNLSDNDLRNMLNTLRQNELLDKSYFYIRDEPTSLADYAEIKVHSDRIKNIAPDAKVFVTFYIGPNKLPQNIDDIMAAFDNLRGTAQIFCTGYWALQNNEENSEKCRKKILPGEEWWTYACMADRPGLSYNSSPIENRIVLWRCWKEQNTGFLYWSVNGFESPEPLASRANLPPGDGVLVYPGKDFGVDKPVVSVRLERWRDGAEDYELLAMMEKKKGRTATLSLLQSVYQKPTQHTDNPSMVESFKTKLIQEIE